MPRTLLYPVIEFDRTSRSVLRVEGAGVNRASVTLAAGRTARPA